MALDEKYGDVTVENDSETSPLNGSEEPVFLFRAQDKLLVPLLARYRNLRRQAVQDGQSEPMEWLADLDARIEGIQSWQENNADRVKLPD